MNDITKIELLESVDVSWSKHKKKYRSSASINIEGYKISIETKYFKTIDQAVTDIKERISNAVLKFYKE